MEKCELKIYNKKGIKNEGPLNYFEKMLTCEIETSIKVKKGKKKL